MAKPKIVKSYDILNKKYLYDIYYKGKFVSRKRNKKEAEHIVKNYKDYTWEFD